MSPRTIQLRWICSLLTLAPVQSFHVNQQLPIIRYQHEHVHDHHNQILGMGGYYAEAEATCPVPPGRHMIFGIPCIEETLLAGPDLELKNLVPVSDEGRYSAGPHTSSLLFQYLLDHVDLRNKSVVEIGATCVSIAAALVWGATSVVVCHPDPDRLRLWEHSLRFFNEKPSRPCQVLTETLPTPFCATDSILPKNADIVVITLAPSLWPDGTTSIGLTSLMHQLLRNGLRVLMIAPDGRIIDEHQEKIHTNNS